jgi:hypothetical protein
MLLYDWIQYFPFAKIFKIFHIYIYIYVYTQSLCPFLTKNELDNNVKMCEKRCVRNVLVLQHENKDAEHTSIPYHRTDCYIIILDLK